MPSASLSSHKFSISLCIKLPCRENKKVNLSPGKQINRHLQSVSDSAGSVFKRRDLALSIAGRYNR